MDQTHADQPSSQKAKRRIGWMIVVPPQGELIHG
jgi:hypothetical protein